MQNIFKHELQKNDEDVINIVALQKKIVTPLLKTTIIVIMVVVVMNVKMVNTLTTPLVPKLIMTTMVAPTIATIALWQCPIFCKHVLARGFRNYSGCWLTFFF
jgi:hypothetical protein